MLSGNARPPSEATPRTSCCPPFRALPRNPMPHTRGLHPPRILSLTSCDRSPARHRKANYAIATFAYVHTYANEGRVRAYSARADRVDFASETGREPSEFGTSKSSGSASDVIGLAVSSLHADSPFFISLQIWEQSGIREFERERNFSIFETFR